MHDPTHSMCGDEFGEVRRVVCEVKCGDSEFLPPDLQYLSAPRLRSQPKSTHANREHIPMDEERRVRVQFGMRCIIERDVGFSDAAQRRTRTRRAIRGVGNQHGCCE